MNNCIEANEMLKPMENKDRNHAMDLIKSIAIFLVVAYHCTIHDYDFNNQSSMILFLRSFVRTITIASVPLFFFVNGYFLFNNKLNLKEHILKIIHLILITCIWNIILNIIFIIIHKGYFSFGDIKRVFVSEKGYINWQIYLWFMGALVCIYILFPIIKSAYDNNKKWFNYFMICTFIVTFGNKILNVCATAFCTIILQKSVAFHDTNFFSMFSPFRGIYGFSIFYFCLGGYLIKFEERIKLIRPFKRNIVCFAVIIICCFGLWALCTYYMHVDSKIKDVLWMSQDTVFTLCNVICIYILCLNFNKRINIIRLISCNTLGIYFSHIIFIELTKPYIMKIPFLCNMVGNAIYALLILLVSLLLCVIMSKIPLIKHLFSVRPFLKAIPEKTTKIDRIV